MTKTAKIQAYMKLNPPEAREVGYDKRVGQKFGASPDYVRKIRRQMGLTGIIGNGVGEPMNKPKDSVEQLADSIRTLLVKSRKKWTVEALSDQLDVGVSKVVKAIESLSKQGVNLDIRKGGVEIAKELPAARKTSVIDTSKFAAHHYTFGLTSDNHLGSKYERMDVLNALFDIWERNGVKDVYQGGNMIEGERHSKTDIHTFGLQGQVDYFVKHWPKRNGITTHFVTGDDHEGWYVQDEGIDIGKFIEMTAQRAGRNDLHYLGHMEHNIEFKAKHGKAIMRVIHAGGGSSYAISYTAQKIVESYSGGEKPQILLVGHYHKMNYGVFREVHVVQAGCTKDQDSFLRKNKIQAHVGGWTIDFDQDDRGIIHNFRVQWHGFYNEEFYKAPWEYKW